MEIIKRHKDSNGVIVGYTVNSNGKEQYLNKDVVVSIFDKITNAHMLSNGEFRANAGESIETVINNIKLVKRPMDISILFIYIADRLFEQFICDTSSKTPNSLSNQDSKDLYFLSKGYDTVSNVYLFLNLYFKYCKEAAKKVLTSAFNNIISKVPKYRLEELKLTLSDL